MTLAFCAVVAVNAASRVDKDKDAEIAAVMADAKLKFKAGDNSVFHPVEGSSYEWRNGISRCDVVSCYDEKDEPDHLDFMLEESADPENSKHYYEVKLVNGKPTVVNHKGVTVKHQVAGRWDMIVFSNARGEVLDVALRKNVNSDDEVVADLRDMINGVWVGTGKNAADTVAFGAVFGEMRSWLPGADYGVQYMDYRTHKLLDKCMVAYFPERMKRVRMPRPSMEMDDNGVPHFYADGKEISRDEYEFLRSRPAGYGGHGSLHGPLWWLVKPQGNDLAVELTEPFSEELDAFYSNFREEKFTLKWVRSPYNGLKDRWAVLSMRPITRGMLAFCDKATLQLMLKYLNGRKSPTDIEKLNKSLIKTMIK